MITLTVCAGCCSKIGGVSPQLSELTGAGIAWSLAGDLAGPIFTAGHLLEIRSAHASSDRKEISPSSKLLSRSFIADTKNATLLLMSCAATSWLTLPQKTPD